MSSVITVENLTKKYIISHQKRERYITLRDTISSGARFVANKIFNPFSVTDSGFEKEEFWALNDVSFEIRSGDRVGIIGRNGAGKSTLLKILSRITEPTSGKAMIYGRVASLLEVGTGFHPELTGRENIFMNGAILGMSKADIKKKFDEIVEFAEVAQFLDTPVKRYSSGMYVRLAFAIAAHLEPEILIVDEVLAVGDSQFQKKCLGKMEDACKEGRTVLFVSHQMAAIQNLCKTGIVLHKGKVKFMGSQLEAISEYLYQDNDLSDKLSSRADRRGTQEVSVYSISFVDSDGREIQTIISGQDMAIRLYFNRNTMLQLPRIVAGIAVRTTFGVPVFLQHTRMAGYQIGVLPECGYIEFRIPRLPLPPAVYLVTYSLIHDGIYIDGISDAAEMVVCEGDFFGSGEVPPVSHGVCLVDGAWSVHSLWQHCAEK